MFKLNFEALDRLTEEGYLRRVISPCEDLVLYNYTDKTTFEKKWNRNTINSRGTVYDRNTGRVVARSFKKFFNFGELAVSKQRNLLKKSEFKVYEKADGSLGNIWFYKGEWHTSTRGSFTSDQAIKAKEMLSKYNLKHLNENYTYLVEIVYPENKIIVDYGDKEELVLLAAKNRDTGEELSDVDLVTTSQLTGVELVKTLNFKSIPEVIAKQSELPAQEEGYVVLFQNGERVKFKSVKYLEVARILSNCSPLTFWANMKHGQVDTEFLEQIPEEFRKEQEDIAHKLEIAYSRKFSQVMNSFKELKEKLGFNSLEDQEAKKAIGLYSKENKVKDLGVMFSIINKDEEGVHNYVHKAVKPVGNIIGEF